MLLTVFVGIFIIVYKDVGVRKILKRASGIQIFVFADISALDPRIRQCGNASVFIRHYVSVGKAGYKALRQNLYKSSSGFGNRFPIGFSGYRVKHLLRGFVRNRLVLEQFFLILIQIIHF